MTPDLSLPTTQEELRDIVVQAWRQGWNDRRAMIGKPMGTVEAEKWQRLDAFVASLDLPPRERPPVVTVREALQKLIEGAHEEPEA